jgi:small subunit ribosomal protein S8
MTMTDPIADLATRIRNALHNRSGETRIPHSKIKAGICEVLKREGYIRDVAVESDAGHPLLRVVLKYGPDGEQVLQSITRVSKPGRRSYRGAGEHAPVLRGMGITVLTTTKGVLSDREARAQNVGGEVLLEVY